MYHQMKLHSLSPYLEHPLLLEIDKAMMVTKLVVNAIKTT